MHHAGPQDFEPPPSGRKNVDFSARLGERKKMRSESQFSAATEIFPGKRQKHSLQIRETHRLVDRETLDLMKHKRMRRVRRVRAINFSGGNDFKRRSCFFHDPDLHGGGLAAEQFPVFEIKRVKTVPRRM